MVQLLSTLTLPLGHVILSSLSQKMKKDHFTTTWSLIPQKTKPSLTSFAHTCERRQLLLVSTVNCLIVFLWSLLSRFSVCLVFLPFNDDYSQVLRLSFRNSPQISMNVVTPKLRLFTVCVLPIISEQTHWRHCIKWVDFKA